MKKSKRGTLLTYLGLAKTGRLKYSRGRAERARKRKAAKKK